MEKFTSSSIDENFTHELLALMGESIARNMFSLMQQYHDENISARKFFETCTINPHGPFGDYVVTYGPPSKEISMWPEFLLAHYGIIGEFYDESEGRLYIKSIVNYDDVKRTFLENLPSDKEPIFPCWADGISTFRFVLKKSNEEVDIDPLKDRFCTAPLIDRFCTEGYLAPRKGRLGFYWTPKIRPILELLGVSNTEHEFNTRKDSS